MKNVLAILAFVAIAPFAFVTGIALGVFALTGALTLASGITGHGWTLDLFRVAINAAQTLI